MIKPYDWQLPATEKQTSILRAGDFAVNASDTGTGKTVCALQTAKDLGIPYAVIAPKNTHTAWRNTIEEMEAHKPVAITNAEKLLWNNPLFKKPNKWLLDPGTLLVWDELHKGASGAKAKTTLICAWAKQAGLKLLAMSATIADNPLKMRALLYHAGICDWSISEFYGFCRRHGCYASPFHSGLEFCKGRKAAQHMAMIGEMLAPNMVRIRVADAPGFPETLIQSKLFDIDDAYRKKIDAIHLELPDEWKDETDNDMVNMLRQRQRMEAYKVPILADLITESIEERVVPVVFVSFRNTLFSLQKELNLGDRVGVVYGGQREKEREATLLRASQDGHDAIILTIDAGGVGINLQAKGEMRTRNSFISPNYNSSSVKQALGRVHRAGGKKSIQTFVLLAGTIEERVHQAIHGKLANIESFNGVSDQDLMGL